MQWQVQAQEAEQASAGGGSVGPHEAGNLPNIQDKVAGQPMVVIIRADNPVETWISTISRYSSANPLVIRITGVQDGMTTDQAREVANKVNQLANITPDQTIVVFGNELNNLEHEWKNPGIDLSVAGSRYAPLFLEFQNVLSEHFRAAASPLDTYNGDYPWEDFLAGALVAYQSAEATVANAYEIPRIGRDVQSVITLVEGATGKSIDFLTEYGYDPEATLEENVNFLRENSPPNGLQASTLVPNKCGDREFSTSGLTEDPWLYYVDGEVYNKEGVKVIIGEGNSCDGSEEYTALDPVLIFPRTDRESAQQGPTDQSSEDALWRRYLANTQVYCSPRQLYLSTEANNIDMTQCQESGNLGPNGNGGDTAGDGVCGPFEFPVVDTTSTTNVQTITFPLFRDDGGSISVEADLSRVDPNDTFAEAARRNSRPEYAPQFYLTTPETQCVNAVRYANYVEESCNFFFEAQPGSEGDGTCGGDIPVTLASGTETSVLQLRDDVLNDESVCSTFNPSDEDSQLTQAVRAIQPHTPRIFKMGFVVQHTHASDENIPLIHQFQNSLADVQKIINWFTGQDANGEGVAQIDAKAGEKLDIIPVWYHVGMAASYFDSAQGRRSYNINPDQPEDVATSGDFGMFTGPLWQNYLPAMQPQHQQFLANTFQNYVIGNNDLMQYMANHFQNMPSDIRDKLYFTNEKVAELTNKESGWEVAAYDKTSYEPGEWGFPLPCLPSTESGGTNDACFCFGDGEGEQCVNQTRAELAQYFPGTYQPSETYLDALRRQIVYRINAGVQSTFRSPQGITDPDTGLSWVDGSLSMRNFSGGDLEICALDQENLRHGYQEEVAQIGSRGQQTEQPEDAESDAPWYSFVTELRSKVMGWGGRDYMAGRGRPVDMKKEQVDVTYLILPDDAMKIGIMQNTLLQMFMIPENYNALINGDSDILPVREMWAAEGVEEGQGFDPIVSAHLRVNGVDRQVSAEAEGYVQVQGVVYQVVCEGESCSCQGDGVGDGNLRWLPKDDVPEDTLASPENGCIGLEIVQENFVGVRGDIPGNTPDERPESPGQLFALFEYIRRMAFTPLHMQAYTEYPGLEEFYAGGANAQAQSDALNRLRNQTPGQCAYQPREIDVQSEYGYSSDLRNPANDPFREDICSVAGATGVPGEYLRAILEIEASPFLRAVRGAGRGEYNPTATSFVCGANRYGAVGPMNLIIGECSTEPSTQGFSNAPNSLDPDLCTISGSMTAAAGLIQGHQSLVSVSPSLNRNAYFAALAERYLGVGSCGSLDDPNDGPEAYAGGPDYCAYVAGMATGKFAGYCR